MTWEIAIEGRTLDKTFDNEEEANTLAAQRRQSPTQKIAVYEIGSGRHHKAFEAKITPHKPTTPKPEPLPLTPPVTRIVVEGGTVVGAAEVVKAASPTEAPKLETGKIEPPPPAASPSKK